MGRLFEKVKGRPREYEEYPPEPEYQSEEIPQEYYEEYRRQQGYVPAEKEPIDDTPLGILKDIEKSPSPKGTFPTVIGGIPVDLHSLEDYVIKISPFGLKTILRYHHARDIEEMKGYGRRGSMNINSKTILLILAAVGMAVMGLIMIMYMPQIMEMFSGGAGI